MPQSSQHGQLIWADLSSYNPATTRPFYTTVLGWQFEGDDYGIGLTGGRPVAGLYQMPEKFVDMGMPSFWMSYIQVDDVTATAQRAADTGAIVEIGPSDFANGGRYALIRDPLGAGFTVYEGPDMTGTTEGAGSRFAHALFVSDAAKVMPFYEGLFGWRFISLTKDSWEISTPSGSTGAHLYEVPDPAVRGKEQYWAVIFNGDAGAAARATAEGGQVIAEIPLHQGKAVVIADPDGGTFMVRPNGQAPAQSGGSPMTFRWKAWAGLALIYLSIATGWSWISALFFALWTVLGLKDRATYLLEPISRSEAPLLYWLTLATYAALVPLLLIYG